MVFSHFPSVINYTSVCFPQMLLFCPVVYLYLVCCIRCARSLCFSKGTKAEHVSLASRSLNSITSKKFAGYIGSAVRVSTHLVSNYLVPQYSNQNLKENDHAGHRSRKALRLSRCSDSLAHILTDITTVRIGYSLQLRKHNLRVCGACSVEEVRVKSAPRLPVLLEDVRIVSLPLSRAPPYFCTYT